MFNVFYKNQKKVNKIVGVPYYSQDFVDYLVSKENIYDSYLVPASEAKNVADLDWNKIYKTIERKYGPVYAGRTITAAKMKWYDFKEQWSEYIINKIKYTEVYDRPESMVR